MSIVDILVLLFKIIINFHDFFNFKIPKYYEVLHEIVVFVLFKTIFFKVLKVHTLK